MAIPNGRAAARAGKADQIAVAVRCHIELAAHMSLANTIDRNGFDPFPT
jgi:hypothetical protein